MLDLFEVLHPHIVARGLGLKFNPSKCAVIEHKSKKQQCLKIICISFMNCQF